MFSQSIPGDKKSIMQWVESPGIGLIIFLEFFSARAVKNSWSPPLLLIICASSLRILELTRKDAQVLGVLLQ
jgi:hypothetical protein